VVCAAIKVSSGVKESTLYTQKRKKGQRPKVKTRNAVATQEGRPALVSAIATAGWLMYREIVYRKKMH
jgi:hypothetical protein